jgi:hypothetical protein
MAINVRAMRLGGLMILSSLVLTACDPKPLAVAVKPPPELLTCSDEPEAPELPAPGVERDNLVLGYVLAMRAAWGDCKSSVDGIRAWSEALPD